MSSRRLSSFAGVGVLFLTGLKAYSFCGSSTDLKVFCLRNS
jgi:hypothetical protein